MRIYRSLSRLLSYCALALAACVGFGPSAFADDTRVAVQHLKFAVADAGHYGACVAKAVAELTYMVSADSVSSSADGLVKMSNGFVQKSLTIREVAEGTSGSIATSQLS